MMVLFECFYLSWGVLAVRTFAIPSYFRLPAVDRGMVMACFTWARLVMAWHAPYPVLRKDLKGDVSMWSLFHSGFFGKSFCRAPFRF